MIKLCNLNDKPLGLSQSFLQSFDSFPPSLDIKICILLTRQDRRIVFWCGDW